MKQMMLILGMLSVLGFGIFGALPAKANFGCLMSCWAWHNDCIADVYVTCEAGDNACITIERGKCHDGRDLCEAYCSICPY